MSKGYMKEKKSDQVKDGTSSFDGTWVCLLNTHSVYTICSVSPYLDWGQLVRDVDHMDSDIDVLVDVHPSPAALTASVKHSNKKLGGGGGSNHNMSQHSRRGRGTVIMACLNTQHKSTQGHLVALCALHPHLNSRCRTPVFQNQAHPPIEQSHDRVTQLSHQTGGWGSLQQAWSWPQHSHRGLCHWLWGSARWQGAWYPRVKQHKAQCDVKGGLHVIVCVCTHVWVCLHLCAAVSVST